MTKRYVFGMLFVFFVVWVVVVDCQVIPSPAQLKQNEGLFQGYTIRKQPKLAKALPLEDEILLHAVVDGREQFYYLDSLPGFELLLKGLSQGTPIQLRYAGGFPKVWKRKIYEIRVEGKRRIGYTPKQLAEKQKELWLFTGIWMVAFVVIFCVGLIKKPKPRK